MADKLTQIQNMIYEIRGQKVMLDSDLARLYDVPTHRLNEAVKRNAKRFPHDFMFQLTEDEWNSILVSQIAISKNNRGFKQSDRIPKRDQKNWFSCKKLRLSGQNHKPRKAVIQHKRADMTRLY